jgi:hypothetical protein
MLNINCGFVLVRLISTIEKLDRKSSFFTFFECLMTVTVAVLTEVPVMLLLVRFVNKTRGRFVERGAE